MSKRTPITPCPKCGHPTAGYRVWKELPKPRTARARRGGMCRTCWRNQGTTSEPRGRGVPRELVLEDWRWLHESGELNTGDSFTSRIAQAAPRIGMSVAALEKALARAGITAPKDDTLPSVRRDKSGGCLQCRKLLTANTEAKGHARMLAGRLARDPDSLVLARALDQAREHLARVAAELDMHRDSPDCTSELEVAA